MNSSPSSFPRIPCSNNWVVIHRIRCQGCTEGSLWFLFLRYMLGIHPLSKQRVKQWPSLSLSPLFINGGWVNSVSVSGGNKCSLSSFTSVPARDIFGVAQRKQCCLLWSRTEAGWVSPPAFPSPDQTGWFKSCLIHSISWYSLIYLCHTGQMTSCIRTNYPGSNSVSVAVSFGKSYKTDLGENASMQKSNREKYSCLKCWVKTIYWGWFMYSIYEHSDVCMHNSYTTKCVTPRNKQYFLLSGKEEMVPAGNTKGWWELTPKTQTWWLVLWHGRSLSSAGKAPLQQITMQFIFRCIQVNIIPAANMWKQHELHLKISIWAESFLTRAQILPEWKITRKS